MEFLKEEHKGKSFGSTATFDNVFVTTTSNILISTANNISPLSKNQIIGNNNQKD